MDLPNGCRFENEAFAVTFSTEDKKEGMKAFLEKRPAQFKGR
jgi:enoyl-CoA hydratase